MPTYTQPTGFLAATFPATVSSYAGGAVASVTGAVGSVTAAVTVGTNNDKTNYALSTAANDLIIDTFLAHTLSKGAANTIERAFWQSSKTSASLTGEVLASGANTATAFLTDIPIDDFAGQVLAIVSGALTGESRAISSVVSGIVTLQKPLTGIPSAGTEFVVVPSQVYSVSEIQAGLATAANQTTTNDRLGYTLAVLAGAISDAQTAAETYAITLGANTFTVDFTGLDSSGNRTGQTLTKV
jgi:hypothetical protein